MFLKNGYAVLTQDLFSRKLWVSTSRNRPTAEIAKRALAQVVAENGGKIAPVVLTDRGSALVGR